MANRRMITGEMFEDDFIGGLDFFDRLLWIGIITAVADDQGRFMDNPALIRSRVFLYDRDINDVAVAATLQTLHIAGKVVRYEAGDKRLVQIVNWWKYQTPAWASPSKYPSPNGWVDRIKYHAPGNKIVVKNWDKAGGYIDDYVPGIGSAIEEGDVNGDGDVKDKDERRGPLPTFDDVQSFVEQLTGIPAQGDAAVKAIDDMLAGKFYAEDIRAGYRWLCDNGKTFRYYSQLVGPSRTEQAKRLQPKSNGNGRAPKVVETLHGIDGSIITKYDDGHEERTCPTS